MAQTAPTWGIVATVADPAPLVAAMVAHHLAEGAAEIVLFLDRPDAGVEALVRHLPRLRCIPCDAAYWAASVDGKRPDTLARRQFLNATHAYRHMVTSDWLLHCDADEFLWTGGTLGAELAAQPDTVDCLILPNLERVFSRGAAQRGLYDGMFRRPRRRFRWLGRLVYGRFRHFLNRGVTAYSIGKGLTRTGRDLDVSIHAAQMRTDGRRPQFATARQTVVLHFDGMTRLHWKTKLLVKAQDAAEGRPGRIAPSRRRTIDWMRDHVANPAAADVLCEALLTIGPVQRLVLRMTGMLATVQFSPEAAIARYCPDAMVTPEAFDADLRRLRPAIAARAEATAP